MWRFVLQIVSTQHPMKEVLPEPNISTSIPMNVLIVELANQLALPRPFSRSQECHDNGSSTLLSMPTFTAVDGAVDRLVALIDENAVFFTHSVSCTPRLSSRMHERFVWDAIG